MIENTINKIDGYIRQLMNNPIAKVIGAETGILVQVFNELKSAVVIIVILVVLDAILGLFAAYKYGCIRSCKMRESIHKLMFYLFVVLLGTFIQVIWGVPYVKEAFVGLIITTEILSILENTESCFPSILPTSILARLGVIQHKKKKK
jgi:phage-related holin